MKNGQHKLYIKNNTIVAPVVAETPSGYMDIEPVRMIACDDIENIRSMICATIQSGNPQGRGYLRNEFPQPIVLKPTKCRSWSEFAKGTICVGWVIEDQRCSVNLIKNMGLKGPLGFEPQTVQEYARDVAEDVFVEAVLNQIRLACVAQKSFRNARKLLSTMEGKSKDTEDTGSE